MFRRFTSLQSFSETFKRLRASGFIRSFFSVGSSKVIASLLNFVFMVYSVRILSKNENGFFQYYSGFLPVLLAIAEFGLPAAMVRYLSPMTEDKRRIGVLLASSLWIKWMALFILILVTAVAALFLRENALAAFLLVFGSFVLSFNSYFESIFVSFGQYQSLSIWYPLPNLIRLVILYFADQFSARALNHMDILAVFSVAPSFTIVLFFFLFPREKLNWSGDREEIQKQTRDLASFNRYAFLASLFAIVSDRMELFFLNKYHSNESVAAYGVALQPFSGFVILFSVLNSIIYPKLSRLTENKEFTAYLAKSILMACGFALALGPWVFLGDWFFSALFSGKYPESVPVFQLLYPNYLFQLVFSPLGMALFALGQPKLLAMLALVRLIFGLVLDNLLIPEYGTMGAAGAFFLGQIPSWLLLSGYFLAYHRPSQK
ncbi:polysaccharide biosynthesis protein [Leptospira langatensis]|uniref:Polysaccharide biosynthesis protein n=1 Tax=Leptospira langatensis TaxID=2484983 RepID=A0A5F1ZWD8_9LEPT|nr:oligosaccharide flippase family protein [Leptospira langatensis]TGJ98258.1 polysaccharide biosynthesis protein [Leptospira langatensis]TGL43172.1 polysaccharide biosynthesis protein [Leptospira langatensis]